MGYVPVRLVWLLLSFSCPLSLLLETSTWLAGPWAVPNRCNPYIPQQWEQKTLNVSVSSAHLPPHCLSCFAAAKGGPREMGGEGSGLGKGLSCARARWVVMHVCLWRLSALLFSPASLGFPTTSHMGCLKTFWRWEN